VTPRGLWARIAVASGVTVVLVLSVSPPHPSARGGPGLAALAGAAGGALLFVVAVRRLPPLGRRLRTSPVAIARQCVLCLCAANEEILWRRVVLGELLVAGQLAALAASSVAFGLAHRRARALHVATGAAFGGLYLATGALAASFAAHWLYNALVAAHTGGEPP
jgi:membrane protease YdiL (CAAX protease family)